MVFYTSYGQTGMYIVTEKYDGMISYYPTFDSVYVTTPAGVTSSYNIPHLILNTPGHDSQLNLIFNGITSQGYRYISTLITSQNNSTVLNRLVEYHIYSFGIPWTHSSRDLDCAKSTQLKIINVSPNPTESNTKVDYIYNFGNEPLQVVVYNMKGFIALEQDICEPNGSKLHQGINTGSVVFDAMYLKPGEYFVTLINKKVYCEAKKIIVL